MKPWRGLRLRFMVASGLLVLTTVVAGAWTLVSLSRLGRMVSETVRDSDIISAATANVSGGLEREDDALLLLLSGDQRARSALAHERAVVTGALTTLLAELTQQGERDLMTDLHVEIAAYRAAADRVAASAPERDALARYHLEANPLLRRAVSIATAIRERRFEAARDAVTQGRDAAEGARRAVLVITLIALAIATAVAVHLTRAVVGPLRTLTRGANAIRQGRFGEPMSIRSRDELGDLAAAFNHMAEDLAEFRRMNVREVLRAKTALEATLEALPDAVALFDADGRMMSMNRTAAEVFEAAGMAAPTAVGDLRLDARDIDRLKQSIRGEIAPPEGTDLARTIPVEHRGAIRRLLPRVVPVPASGQDRGGAILLLYDVTELAKIDEMRSELVAVASHELQTPLTTLRMTLLMLREGVDALPDRQRELVTTALLGVEQLTDIVHEFLDLTRIEAGELRLNLEAVQVTSVVRDAVDRSASRAAAQSVRLIASLAPDVPVVRGDARRLRTVLDNLLSNALKYSPPGGTVTVDVSVAETSSVTQQASVVVSVTDAGPGVPVAYRARVFEKFFRLEHHLLDHRPGARGEGIGLYMCRQIIERHGGHVGCTAGAHGQGARFFVELPPATAEPVASEMRETPARG
jgi:NtrC-family two-component system sensor histidine kinase KinB